jgi:hypothetical protein
MEPLQQRFLYLYSKYQGAFQINKYFAGLVPVYKFYAMAELNKKAVVDRKKMYDGKMYNGNKAMAGALNCSFLRKVHRTSRNYLFAIQHSFAIFLF